MGVAEDPLVGHRAEALLGIIPKAWLGLGPRRICSGGLFQCVNRFPPKATEARDV